QPQVVLPTYKLGEQMPRTQRVVDHIVEHLAKIEVDYTFGRPVPADILDALPNATDPFALSLNENPFPPLPAVRSAQYRNLLSQAGFQMTRAAQTASPLSVVEARAA
ncbi:MAG: hypothetical protein WBF82_11340, partial [Mycobacterium sp.]